eukprot:1055807-Rhodomonas_salina.1
MDPQEGCRLLKNTVAFTIGRTVVTIITSPPSASAVQFFSSSRLVSSVNPRVVSPASPMQSPSPLLVPPCVVLARTGVFRLDLARVSTFNEAAVG